MQAFLIRAHEFSATGPALGGSEIEQSASAAAALASTQITEPAAAAGVPRRGDPDSSASADGDSGGEDVEYKMYQETPHMEECLRRVTAMYLPAARHQLLAKNRILDARVLWVDATAAPCMYAVTIASTEMGALQFACPEASAVPAVQCCISIKTACFRGNARVLRAGQS